MTENKYWAAFRKYLVPRVYAWKINASYIGGIPDWWGSGSLQDLWVENKRIKLKQPPPFLDLTDHTEYLTILQQEWLIGRYNEGRHVGVLVFSEWGHVYFPDLTWQKKMSRMEFLEKAMPYKDMANKLIEILGVIQPRSI